MTNRLYQEDLEECKLKGKDAKPISNYPNNVSFLNFTLYMWTPALVYEQEYPRNKHFRVGYFFWKAIYTLMSLLTAYILFEDYVLITI